jgi:hypothetical protein
MINVKRFLPFRTTPDIWVGATVYLPQDEGEPLMARFSTVEVLGEAIEHAKTLGIDDITFAPGIYISMLDFCKIVQTLRLTEGNPTRLMLPTHNVLQGGKHDYILIKQDGRRVLHVRNPTDFKRDVPLFEGKVIADMDFFEVLVTDDRELMVAYLETKSPKELAAFAGLIASELTMQGETTLMTRMGEIVHRKMAQV